MTENESAIEDLIMECDKLKARLAELESKEPCIWKFCDGRYVTSCGNEGYLIASEHKYRRCVFCEGQLMRIDDAT